jgi:hypothetical protein
VEAALERLAKSGGNGGGNGTSKKAWQGDNDNDNKDGAVDVDVDTVAAAAALVDTASNLFDTAAAHWRRIASLVAAGSPGRCNHALLLHTLLTLYSFIVASTR